MKRHKFNKLILVTGSYPYSAAAENTFLPQEIEVLSGHFEEIILVPKRTDGTVEKIPEANVKVETGYAVYINSKFNKIISLALLIFDSLFYKEFIKYRKTVFTYPSVTISIIRSRLYARMSAKWFRKFIKSTNSDWEDFLLVTWWFDPSTLGLLEYAEKQHIPVITRAHGYDLYEHRHVPAYIPFRDFEMANICSVYPDSLSGKDYLAEKYPVYRHKIETGFLGVKDPGYSSQSSVDGAIRILSCSFLLPVKRINLLIQGLAKLGELNPSGQFEWVHIGGGPEKETLVLLAKDILPDNIRHTFIDYPGKEELNAYYRNNPVDLFINVSKSEGTPVSIMEAISFGIPVMATSVGGNKEIVIHEQTGILISENPSPANIAMHLGELFRDNDRLKKMRQQSKLHWYNYYNAEKNYDLFVRSILQRASSFN